MQHHQKQELARLAADDAINLLGTTGEPNSISLRQRLEIMQAVSSTRCSARCLPSLAFLSAPF